MEGGLGLDIIGKYIGIQYERSCRVSAALGCYADINKVKEAQSMMLREIRSEVRKYGENKRATLELKMESVQKLHCIRFFKKAIKLAPHKCLDTDSCLSQPGRAFTMDVIHCKNIPEIYAVSKSCKCSMRNPKQPDTDIEGKEKMVDFTSP
ncbi:hypothetical protein GJ496_001535 [Pomphorhynchus laevis]|nr:hypothetical protein GJ496_001535 [Pomphorhynchus laevis]